MRPKENYFPWIGVAFGLTLAILGTFQVYIFREPARIAADEARNQASMVGSGGELFAQNCASCHGEQGEGVDAPALNDKKFLAETHDEVIFGLIGSGVPGSEMPAWNQAHGGPYTDQEVRELVAFIRNWEPSAPDRQAEQSRGDPAQGLAIFRSTCFACHGENGLGSDRAPALNDTEKLAQFDDEWYVDTIASGRPAKGMPTWGTVLSPEQIRDIVALLRAWQRGEAIELPGPEERLHEAAHALEQNEAEEAKHRLEEAAEEATGEQLAVINTALAALEKGDLAAALEAVEKAETMESEASPGKSAPMDMGGETLQPGQAEARAALEDIEMGMAEDAIPRLEAALGLAQGELKEAIEHALEDLRVGKTDEAREVLEKALGSEH